MSLVSRAEELARAAHEGQTDKAGKPYAEHPRRVAGHVSRMNLTSPIREKALMVAWMHDVVEDTPVGLDDLRREFPEDVVLGVDAMTKRDGEPAEDYYARVKAHPLALIVKEADLLDNTDPSRTALLPEETRARLAAKYAKAREHLGLGPAEG